MVCPRCIQAVKESLQALEIPFESIELGKVTLVNSLLKDQKSELAKSLSEKGFELLESKKMLPLFPKSNH